MSTRLIDTMSWVTLVESPLCSPSSSLWGMKADQSEFKRECFNPQGVTTKQKQKKNRKKV